MKYIYREEEMEQKNPIQVAGRLFGALEFLADAGSAECSKRQI